MTVLAIIFLVISGITYFILQSAAGPTRSPNVVVVQSGSSIRSDLAPESFTQKYRLIASFPNDAQGKGSAIVAIGNGAGRRFAVGDTVEPETRLIATYHNYAILLRYGAKIRIELSNEAVAAARAPAPTTYEFRRDIRLVERRKFGIPHGFSVEALGDGAAYRAVGFQPGDILLGINGRGLKGAEDAIEALQYRLPDQTTEILVERNGQRVTLELGPPAP